MPMDQIAAKYEDPAKHLHGAPFYVLGPLVTDIAPGYDHHIRNRRRLHAQNGAAFFYAMRHTGRTLWHFQNVEDVKQGIIASKIAAHAADIAKRRPWVRERSMIRWQTQRRVLDWDAQWECAIDPKPQKQSGNSRKPEHEDTCSMCGKFCAVQYEQSACRRNILIFCKKSGGFIPSLCYNKTVSISR